MGTTGDKGLKFGNLVLLSHILDTVIIGESFSNKTAQSLHVL